MLQIKPMTPEEFSFATALANTMDWKMSIQDFQFMTMLEPKGCFVLFDNLEPIGIATNISYGNVGWFGNLIVEEKYRGFGAGSMLVKHSIEYLHGKGVETIGLYAYPHLIPFYNNLGFRNDEDFSVMSSRELKFISSDALPHVIPQDLQQVAVFDKRCFGGDRRRLLESIILDEGNLSYYCSEHTNIIGYVAATVYEKMAWIGPLMCQGKNVNTALKLLKSVLAELKGIRVHVAIPKKENLLVSMLLSIGFREDFSVMRMFFGKDLAKNCIYLAESLERG